MDHRRLYECRSFRRSVKTQQRLILEEVDFTHPALWHTDCTYLAGYEGWL